MVKVMEKKVHEDREKGIQAKVDDESHLNRYFYDHAPSVILSRGFVYPEHKTKAVQTEYLLNVDPYILAVGMPDGSRTTE
jgi:hypothetical protein